MEAVAESKSMQEATNLKFGFGVLAAYAGHHAAACGCVDDIGHQTP